MPSQITCFGSLNYDLVSYTPRIPEAGETSLCHRFETHVGGKGFNQTIAAQRLKPPEAGVNVRIIGKVGSDEFGRALVARGVAEGVDMSSVETSREPTGVATIIVEDSGENRILVALGANRDTDGFDGADMFEDCGKSGAGGAAETQYLILQNERPDALAVLTAVRRTRPDVAVVYNPSPFQPLPRHSWQLPDVLVLNETEARAVAAEFGISVAAGSTPEISATELCAKLVAELSEPRAGRPKTVLITLGARGACFHTELPGEEQSQHVPAFDLRGMPVVDTTGAGDTFLGGLVAGLAAGNPLKEAVKFAVAASAISVTRRGAADGIPRYSEVKAMMERDG